MSNRRKIRKFRRVRDLAAEQKLEQATGFAVNRRDRRRLSRTVRGS